MKKRKSTINKRNISAHTRRFRTLYAFDADKGMRVPVGESAPAYMRSMAMVGGLTRRAMKKRQRVDQRGLSAMAMLPAWMQTGLAVFNKAAQAFREKHEALQAEKRAQKIVTARSIHTGDRDGF